MGNRTALFSRHQPGGVFTIADVIDHPGDIWFVDSGAAGKGDTVGHGRNPDQPFATIDFAIGQCTANKGDVIYVLPGHAETLTAKIACDVAGVRIIGLGHSDSRPAITVGGAIDGIDITADDVEIENLRFPTPTAAATAVINVAAARSAIRGSRFELGANAVDPVTVTAAGERPLFEDNEVQVTANGPDEWIIFEGVVDNPVIRRNHVIGSDGTNAFDDGVINYNSQAVTNPMVYDNHFDGQGVATTVVANGGSVVGGLTGPNTYAGSATSADNVSSQAAGTIFAVKKTLTSSAIVQAGVDVTGVSSGGNIEILDIHMMTDGTGLAGGTNFEVRNNNAKGAALVFAETVANLGANKSERLGSGSATAGQPFVLESGKKITADSTAADCTGSGTIDLYIVCRRLADGASLAAA